MKIGDKVRTTHTKWAGCEGEITKQFDNGNFQIKITRYQETTPEDSRFWQVWSERDLKLIVSASGDTDFDKAFEKWMKVLG